jgi:hypothetical protein
MSELAALYQQAFQHAEQAVIEDQKGNKEVAKEYYLRVLKVQTYFGLLLLSDF